MPTFAQLNPQRVRSSQSGTVTGNAVTSVIPQLGAFQQDSSNAASVTLGRRTSVEIHNADSALSLYVVGLTYSASTPGSITQATAHEVIPPNNTQFLPWDGTILIYMENSSGAATSSNWTVTEIQ